MARPDGATGVRRKTAVDSVRGPDRRLVKAVHQVVLNAVPRARICKNIMLAMHSALDDMAPGTAVAMLLTGPGRGPASPAVRLWAKSLTEAAERFAVPLEPIFSANDECLLHVEPA